jgi:hypothetical protein
VKAETRKTSMRLDHEDIEWIGERQAQSRKLGKAFPLKSGIRQECPLSLFLLCT